MNGRQCEINLYIVILVVFLTSCEGFLVVIGSLFEGMGSANYLK